MQREGTEKNIKSPRKREKTRSHISLGKHLTRLTTRLLYKLNLKNRFRGMVFNLFKSYLSDKQQRVKIIRSSYEHTHENEDGNYYLGRNIQIINN